MVSTSAPIETVVKRCMNLLETPGVNARAAMKHKSKIIEPIYVFCKAVHKVATLSKIDDIIRQRE